MKRIFKKIFEYIPIFSFVMIVLSFISLIFLIIFSNSSEFADFFNKNMASVVRFLMATITTWIPFSLAEIILMLTPIWLFLLIFLAIKYGKEGKKASIRYFSVIVSIVLFVFITFVWTYSSGFHTTPIDESLALNTNIDKDDIYISSNYIVDNLNELADKIEYDENGSSKITDSYDTLSKKICSAYKRYASEYGLIKTFDSSIKPIILSEPMTYTHISGVYTFMTGEGNFNTNYPDFVVVASIAHELSHQRGVARENEANITAFIVLINSDDPYLQYCGYLSVYTNVLNALYSSAKEQYYEVVSKLDSRVRRDLANYSEFFKKYTDSKAAEVTDKINNSYLQANGQENGTKSYGMIVESACAYIIKYKMH